MQGLQEVFGLNPEESSWIASGYLGAISSGQTTCGLLASATAALGLAFGKGKSGTPEENEADRQKIIGLVNKLYRDFIEKFRTTECKTLLQYDFSAEGQKRFIEEKIYTKCNGFMDFVLNWCMDLEEQEKV